MTVCAIRCGRAWRSKGRRDGPRDHRLTWYGNPCTRLKFNDAERRLAALVADAEQPAIARATAPELLREFLSPASMPVVEAALHDADALVRRAALALTEALPPERRVGLAAAALRDPIRAVRLAAAQALAGARAALGADGQIAFDRGIEEVIASEMLGAERPESHLNLANLYLRLGRPAEAESELRTALRLDPRFVPALVNLADLLRGTGGDAAGAALLDEALRVEPGNAEAIHALDLLRVRLGRPTDAVVLRRRAATLRPTCRDSPTCTASRSIPRVMPRPPCGSWRWRTADARPTAISSARG